MKRLKMRIHQVIDSGIQSGTSDLERRYIRFLNSTLILFACAQLPIFCLLLILKMTIPLLVNLLALSLCGVGFILNRRGAHLVAKILIVLIVNLNTLYFTLILGSSAPTHFWLIPSAILGLLVFKPTERLWALILVGLSVVSFIGFELIHADLEAMIQPFNHLADQERAIQGSMISAMILVLILVGLMHQRFALAEAELSKEKAESDRLLRAILPEQIALELRKTGKTKAIKHEEVSILFADLVGFTPLAASMSAEDVVALLAKIFERFDYVIKACGVEKIKTIGDAYMIAGGLPQPTPDHAERLAQCALKMVDELTLFNQEANHQLQIRIGIHCGTAVAGVIGSTKFAYDLWGESVNLASRLESSGEPGRIQVSEQFRDRLKASFSFEERGEIELKGVGKTRTYWMLG